MRKLTEEKEEVECEGVSGVKVLWELIKAIWPVIIIMIIIYYYFYKFRSEDSLPEQKIEQLK